MFNVHGHLGKALSVAYPEFSWILAKFKISPPGIWEQQNQLQKFFEDCKEKFGIKNLDDWYKVPRYKVEAISGPRLFNAHNSLGHALKVAYPDHQWILSRFVKASSRWKNQQSVKEFLDYCKQELDIQKPEDWTRVSLKQLEFLGGNCIVHFT